jgi:DNA mismatch endonuclease Vsr
MRRFGIVGWRRGIKLPGKPDFVFRRARVVVFVDGDFWHGNPRCYRLPKSNVEYWKKKIEGNRARDKEITRTLKRLGWRVIRIWESALGDEEAVAARIRAITMPQARVGRPTQAALGPPGRGKLVSEALVTAKQGRSAHRRRCGPRCLLVW